MSEDEIREVFMAGYRMGAMDWSCCYGSPDDRDVIEAHEQWRKQKEEEVKQ